MKSLNETLGEINTVDDEIMKEELQTQRRVVSDTTELNIRTIETALFERRKKTLYSGTILYSDWEEKEGTRSEEKKVLIDPPPEMIPEERIKEEILGEERIVDSTIEGDRQNVFFGKRTRLCSGRIMQKKRRIVERRYCQVFRDGTIKHTPWEITSDIESSNVIGTFGDGEQNSCIGIDGLVQMVNVGSRLVDGVKSLCENKSSLQPYKQTYSQSNSSNTLNSHYSSNSDNSNNINGMTSNPNMNCFNHSIHFNYQGHF